MTERLAPIAQGTARIRLEGPSEDVIASARGGDPTALESLLESCLPIVYSYSLRRLHHVQSAEDTAQEVAIKVIKKISHYDQEKGPFLNWLFTIAHNHIIDIQRRNRRRTQHEFDSGSAEHLEDPRPSPDRLVQLGEVVQACKQLPYAQRQVFLMTSLKGMTDPETAKALGKPLGTIKTRRRLALGKIRHALNGESAH